MTLVCGTDAFVETVAGPIQRITVDGQKRWLSRRPLERVARKVQGPLGGYLAQWGLLMASVWGPEAGLHR